MNRFKQFYSELDEVWFNWIFIGLGLLYAFAISSQFDVSSQFYMVYGSLALFAVMYIFWRDNSYVSLFIKLFGLFLAFRYLYWRTTESLKYEGFFDFIGALLIYGAEVYAITIYAMGIFTSLMLLNRRVIDISSYENHDLPTVDVYIPTYNEPIDMVENTVLASLNFNYPSERYNVFILDDGGTDQKCNDKDPLKAQEARHRREYFQAFCEKNGARYLTRERNLHAKAGNINTAFLSTHGEHVLILDCDHIPTRDFLKNTVGWLMKDPKMFLVQTPHSFYNPDPVERNLNIFRDAPSENEMFYKHIQKGHDFWESSFFCGSGALIRRSHLDEVGGISGDTITEDAETALGLHARGYKSAYIDIPMLRGLQAETFAGLVLQRIRWTQGMIQIFLLKNPLRQKGLSWHQKISYMSASMFWFFSFARVVFLIAPLFYLFFGLKVYSANGTELLAYTLPHIIVALFISFFLYSKVRWSFFSEIYETALSIFTLPAIIEVLYNPRAPDFKVTPKGENLGEDFVSHLAIPFVILLVLTGFGFVAALYRLYFYPQDIYVIVMTTIWNIFNFLMLVIALAITSEKKQLRQYMRIPAQDQAVVQVQGQTFMAQILDLSMGGIAVRVHERENFQRLVEGKPKDFTLTVLVKDTEQHFTLIEAIYLSTIKDKVVLQFMNVEENITLRQKLIALIFGENTRWLELDKQERALSPLQSLGMLIMQGFRNVYFKKAFLLTFTTITGYLGQKLIHITRKWNYV